MVQALANALVPIFVGLLVGYWGGRRKWLDIQGVHTLIAVVMNVAVPCAMFSAIVRTTWSAVAHQTTACWIVAAAFLTVFLLTYFLTSRISRFSMGEAAVLALTLGFPNCAAVAIPLLSDLYGPDSKVLASLSIAVGALTVSPITLALLEIHANGEEDRLQLGTLLQSARRSMARPVVWAPLVALILSATHLHLPGFAQSSLRVLGDASTGTALLLTGLILSEQTIAITRGVAASAVAKTFLQPLLALLLCLLFRVEASTMRQVTLICAIPAGFFGLVFGKRYQTAPSVAGSSLVLTYLLSVVTLPVWALILSRIQG